MTKIYKKVGAILSGLKEKYEMKYKGTVFNKETLVYMIWGGLTAFLTVSLYFILVNLDLLNIPSIHSLNVVQANTISNFIGIACAYVTNKKYVFHTEHESKSEQRKEMYLFFVSRISTFILETILLIIIVGYLDIDKNIAKIFTSLVIVILNYFIAKIAVFSK